MNAGFGLRFLAAILSSLDVGKLENRVYQMLGFLSAFFLAKGSTFSFDVYLHRPGSLAHQERRGVADLLRWVGNSPLW
jgi:hypothetical protein